MTSPIAGPPTLPTWFVADSAWWHGRWFGRCALPFAGGDAPVDVLQVPPGVTVHRVAGTLLPGLHDEHVHACLVDLASVRAGGIAVCHDLGGTPEELARQRARPGLPRLDVVGAFLTAAGGYPSDRAWAAPGSWRAVLGVGDAATAVSEQIAAGAGAIKVAVHRDAGPVLPASVMRAVVDAAHAVDRPVVVHAEGSGATALALDAGADRLAHTPWSESLDPGLIRACAARVTWLSTLDIHGWGSPSPQRAIAIRNLSRFLEAGGRIRYGTDLGNGPLPPGVNPREIRALQAAGMTPDDVLLSMTTDGPDQVPLSWVPGGLDADPAGFADSLATARVLEPELH